MVVNLDKLKHVTMKDNFFPVYKISNTPWANIEYIFTEFQIILCGQASCVVEIGLTI